MSSRPAIVWFRSDLRVQDNPALFYAHRTTKPLIFLYIYPTEQGGFFRRGKKADEWLFHSLKSLAKDLAKRGGRLILREGDSASVLSDMIQETGADQVYVNEEYDPFLAKRDKKLRIALAASDVSFHSFHGNLLINPYEILRISEKPFKEFSPFWKMVSHYFEPEKPYLISRDFIAYAKALYSISWIKPETKTLPKSFIPGEGAARERLENFIERGLIHHKPKKESEGSKLSIHLAFGEISPREIWHRVPKTKQGRSFLRQLGYREFAYHLLIFFPETPFHPLKKEYRKFPFYRNEESFTKWKQAKTGYPIIDAALTELKRTGYLPQIMRNLLASFWVTFLLLPWQEGAAWLSSELIDADLAANIFLWQMAARCGASPENQAPFDPIKESFKLDPFGSYIKRYLPKLKELSPLYLHAPSRAPKELLEKAGITLGVDYPYPIIEQEEALKRAETAYASVTHG